MNDSPYLFMDMKPIDPKAPRNTSFTFAQKMSFSVEMLENMAEAYEEGEIEGTFLTLDIHDFQRLPETLQKRLKPFVSMSVKMVVG